MELDEPSEDQLRAIFDEMDEDNSGEVNLLEATQGTLAIWPYVNARLVANAFEAADADGARDPKPNPILTSSSPNPHFILTSTSPHPHLNPS